ncbi:MAG: YcgN family cysteine cluster protein [Ectothiorhodospira sp.]
MSAGADGGVLVPGFWEGRPLEDLSRDEWEALCDGCGRCCLHKLQDADTDEIYFTDVACRLLDLHSCRCGDYARRTRHVPDCIALWPDEVAQTPWLPSTCAYRLLAQGDPLPEWHPLVSGDPQSVHAAGVSVRGRVISEEAMDDDWEAHVVQWPG